MEETISVENVLVDKLNEIPQVRQWLIEIIDFLNLGLEEDSFLYILLSFGIVLLFVGVVEVLLRFLFVRSVPNLLQRIPSLSDVNLKSLRRGVSKVIRILSASLFLSLLPVVFVEPGSVMLKVLSMICGIYITVLVAQLLSQVLDMTRAALLQSEKHRNSPTVNLTQVIKALVWFVAVLYIISIVLSIDVKTVTASLAALSAVLMLVFKDSILGFVASIQLSSNDMVRVGDWIVMDKYNADGDVIDISLATIKVQNFDKTVSTIPPYSLISDSFRNYRFMRESGGRRVKRSIYIDLKSIVYADEDLLSRLRSEPVLKEYIETITREIEVDNMTNGLQEAISRRRLTNIGLFRRYALEYLRNNPFVHKEYTLMVRQLQPTDTGLPLELYFFTNTTVWAEYENIQSDVFDHLFAVVGYFDLDVFQGVNGNDVRQLITTKDSSGEE